MQLVQKNIRQGRINPAESVSPSGSLLYRDGKQKKINTKKARKESRAF